MPQYFFHSADGSRELDRDGLDLPDLRSAQHEAVAYAGEVLKHEPEKLWVRGQWRVEVADAENRLLFTVITIVVDAPTPK